MDQALFSSNWLGIVFFIAMMSNFAAIDGIFRAFVRPDRKKHDKANSILFFSIVGLLSSAFTCVVAPETIKFFVLWAAFSALSGYGFLNFLLLINYWITGRNYR